MRPAVSPTLWNMPFFDINQTQLTRGRTRFSPEVGPGLEILEA